MALTPKQIANLITEEVGKALDANWSRYGVEWGGFSVKLNREVTRRIKEGDLASNKLKVCFGYWALCSEAVEMAHKLKSGKMINQQHFDLVVSQIEEIKSNIDADIWEMAKPT